MENKMETTVVTVVSWGYRGITEKTMETTIPVLYISLMY